MEDPFRIARLGSLMPLLPMELFFGMDGQDVRRFWMTIEELLTAHYPAGPAPCLVYKCIETRLRGPAAAWWDNNERTRRHRGDRRLSATNLQKIKHDFMNAFGGNMDYRNCLKRLKMVKQFDDESLPRYRERILHILWNHGVPDRGGSEFARTLCEESGKVFVNGLRSDFISSSLENMEFPSVDAAFGAVNFIEHMLKWEKERWSQNAPDDFSDVTIETITADLVPTQNLMPSELRPYPLDMRAQPIPVFLPPFPMPYVAYMPS